MVLSTSSPSARLNYGRIADKLKVVSQLVRSPGVYFTATEDRATGRLLYSAKLIPNRGAWLEIETSSKDVLTVKIDRKRKVPVTALVRALGYGTKEDIRAFFADVD